MNYYDILKVSKTASEQEIRASYKNLIKKYHPDIYTENHEYAEKITKELNDAYKVLSNSESRKEYDLSLEEPISYVSPQQTYTNVVDYEEPPKETIEQILRKKIYNIVDEKTKTMSKKSKTLMVISIILIALLLMALAIQDFINVVKL